MTEKWTTEEVFKILLQTSTVFGSAPVRFEPGNGRYSSVRISPSLYYYNILLALAANIPNIYYFYLSLNNDGEDMRKYHHLAFYDGSSFIAAVTHYLLHPLPLVVVAYSSSSRIKTFLSSYSSVHQIRKTISSDGHSGIKKWKVVILLVITIFGMVILMAIDVWMRKIALIYYIYMFVLHEIWNFMEYQFAFVVIYANMALNDINRILEEILYLLDDKTTCAINEVSISVSSRNFLKPADCQNIGNMDHISKNRQRARIVSLVRQLSEYFASVCGILNETNNTESLYLFFYLGSSTLGIERTIVITYTALKSIAETDLANIILLSVWGSYHIFRIMIILEPSHTTQKELSKTRLLVGRLMCHSAATTKPMMDVLDTFYKQLLLNNVTASVLDMFTLDRSTLSMVVGASTTIFMIMKYVEHSK